MQKIALCKKNCYTEAEFASMSLTRQVAHNTIIQIIGKVVSTILGVVALGMLARYLGVEQFGWYTTTVAFLQFVGILTDFGLIPVTAQMMGENNGLDKKKLLQNLFGFRLTTSVFFFLLAPLIALLFSYPREVHEAIAISAIGFVGIGLNQVLTGYFQYRLKMHVQSIAEFISRVVLIGVLFLIITWQTSFVATMGLIVIPNLVFTLFLFFGAKQDVDIKPAYDWTMWKIIIIKMWPIAISILFNVVYLKGDLLILASYRSQSEVGLYGSAYRVVDIIAQTSMLFMGIVLPLLAASWSQKNLEQFKKRAQKSFDGLFLLAIPSICGIAFLAPQLMTLISGKEFVLAGIPLKILSLAIFGVFLGSFFGHVAVAIDQQKRTIWVYLSCAILTLVGYFVFIPLYGMTGAAWMSAFSEIYVGVMLAIVIYPLSKLKLNFSPFIKSIVCSLIMVGVLLPLQSLPTLFLIPLGGLVYTGSLYLTGGISKNMVQEILSLKK